MNSRTKFLLLVPMLLLAGGLLTRAFADQAKDLMKAGAAAEVRKNYDLAYQDYRKALDLHPDRTDYMLAARRAQFEASVGHIHAGELLRDQKKYPEAAAEMQQALDLDPSNAIAQQELKQIEELMHPPPPPPGEPVNENSLDARLAEAAPPADLGPISSTPIDLTLSNDSRIAFTTIGTLAHLNVIFDADFKSQHVNLELKQTPLLEALRVLDLQADTFYTVVTPNTIYVANDTPTKRTELQQMVVKTFYMHNLTKTQDLTEVVNSVRTLLGGQPRMAAVASSMAVIMRDTPDRVAVAAKLFDDLDKAPPEVVVDVKVMSVNRDLARDLGILPPNSTTISLNSTTTNTTSTTGTTSSTTTNPTLYQLAHLTGNDFTVSISSATLNALLSDSNTRTVQEPQLRAVQGVKATLLIGQKIPVATGSFQPGIGGVGINPLVNTQFTYQNVGVSLELTPYIHDQDVTLDHKVEISEVDSETNLGGIEQPIIGTRSASGTVDLNDGESSVLAGAFEDSIIHNISGVPGLNTIPGLGFLFSTHHDEVQHTELMIVLTPHIVRTLDLTRLNNEAIDTGTENNVTLRELPPATAAPAPPAGGANRPEPPAPAPTPARVPAPAPNPTPAAPTSPQRNQAMPPPAPGSTSRGGGMLSFSPPQIGGRVGTPITVKLDMTGVGNDYALAFQLRYNPAVLHLDSVADGGFMSQDGKSVALVHVEDVSNGSSEVSVSRPPNAGGVSGTGAVAVFTFTPKAAGDSPLTLSRVVARDPNGQQLPVATEGATVIVH